ncbi:uncharacterized protein M421DRAFT_408236 [Didymella exigua CBS 183.55]|uniref:RTA1-domain-containing protein n=1 Tax=Didymella exigua CBS 183.55 TaxID=1150837 RepID=A0A6A5R5F1_9PLEO|nr:uncharacterized protein M421DRAFT_408236 [Didymella exigua CBS 183.55]KAF1922932.1 hypothetical protein M421DRAFT_408236 [Didymella exigua CBS 183.55]
MASRPQGATQGYINPNWPPPGEDGDAVIIIYGYTPKFALYIFALVLFFTLGLGNGWQVSKYRTWYFSTMLVGTVFEIIGYIARGLSAKRNPYKVSYFVIQYFFIVVEPVFFAAAIYTVLSILIRATPDGTRHAPLRPKLILWTFITCDVIATVIQILGAVLIGVAYSNRRDPTRLITPSSKVFYASFWLAVLSIYLRICFRLAETAQGLAGELQSREVYFGTL